MDKDAIIALLQQQNETQNEQIKALVKQLTELQTKIDLLLHKLYGKKSERKKPDDVPPEDKTKTSKTTTTHSNGKPRGRSRQFPENLPRETIKYDLTEEQKKCACGRTKHCIGKEVTEQLDIVPASLFVREHVRYKYSCRCGMCGVEIAAMPAQPIDKGIPAAGLLADIISAKFIDSMPLYRQMQRFKRHGIEISDSTLCDWIGASAQLLAPMVDEIKIDLLRDIKMHTDDTPVPVLAKGKTKQGRLWVYLTDGINTPACTVYDYTPTRAQAGPIKFLGDYQGYLQADAYPGYDKLYATKKIIEVGCMAHCRRKFHEVSIAAKGSSTVDAVLLWIGELYKIERLAKPLNIIERYFYRKRYSRPILKKIKRWLDKTQPKLLPNTPIMSATQYMINHWRALNNYLLHGALHIDNNAAERAIRPITLGRKNWLFAGSDEGGKRTAILFSIIETCKQNQINIFDYLKDVLARIPNTKQKDIRSLLPYHWRPDDKGSESR